MINEEPIWVSLMSVKYWRKSLDTASLFITSDPLVISYLGRGYSTLMRDRSSVDVGEVRTNTVVYEIKGRRRPPERRKRKRENNSILSTANYA